MRKSSSADKTLEAALRALRRALSASKARWMVIGGVAVIAHGVQRMTTDLDAVIEGGAIELRQLLRQLQEAAIVPRIAAAVAFAEANLVLLVRHLPSEVDLDLSLAWTSFERDALAERELRRARSQPAALLLRRRQSVALSENLERAAPAPIGRNVEPPWLAAAAPRRVWRRRSRPDETPVG